MKMGWVGKIALHKDESKTAPTNQIGWRCVLGLADGGAYWD